MFGGVVKSAGWATILVASGVILGGSVSAKAADLGGDCCADLEERIAELEATTADKGNRKVSLKISGWVNEAVVWWDDGQEQNVYVGTNALEQSRFKFSGEAKISNDWSAGYTIEVGIVGNASNKWNQDNASLGNGAFTLRKSYWFVKSKSYGTVSVGQNGTATYHLLDDADGANTRNYSDAQAAAVAVGGFKILSGGVQTGLTWGNVLRGFDNGTPGQSGRRNIVRYDSPEFGGFVASASWGEDDIWDAALTFKKTIGDVSVTAKGGYGESTDEVGTKCGGPAADFKCTWWGGAATLMHNPTGIYVFGGYGEMQIDSLGAGVDDSSTTWFIQSGIEKKWMPLGTTTVFGEYRHDEPGANGSLASATSFGADLDFWAAGVVQNIDAAAMDLYAIYRHSDGDYLDAVLGQTSIDDFDMVITGARIQF